MAGKSICVLANEWVASTGADSVPYFRVFNPMTQSSKFDKEGAYIRKYVSELKSVPASQIHDPSVKMPATAFKQSNYPKPMVDHTEARKAIIDAFKALKTAE